MSKRLSVVAGVVLAAALGSAHAHAQMLVMPSGHPTWYLGGEGGWTDLESQKNHFSGLGSAREKYDDGFNVGARAGLEWGPWRLEEEYNYRNSGLHSLDIGGVDVPGASGQREAHAIMTNVIYDFNLGWPVTPHIGAGVGAVDIIDGVKAPGVGQVFNDNSWVFGYQGIAGIRYNLSPQLALDVDYRYLATTDGSFNVPGDPGLKYHSGYSSHNILASITYRFAPPPPPPPVEPAAAPAPPPAPSQRVFLVFFDWDRAAITSEGMQIIRQAADAYKAGGSVRLQVTGYTDRSGSVAYNQRLSERRANAVANALVNLGVPRSDMDVTGRGENDNRVPTANGVREPQNRRVEIVMP
jgi:OmpA-OmpF porin, OOP family